MLTVQEGSPHSLVGWGHLGVSLSRELLKVLKLKVSWPFSALKMIAPTRKSMKKLLLEKSCWQAHADKEKENIILGPLNGKQS